MARLGRAQPFPPKILGPSAVLFAGGGGGTTLSLFAGDGASETDGLRLVRLLSPDIGAQSTGAVRVGLLGIGDSAAQASGTLGVRLFPGSDSASGSAGAVAITGAFALLVDAPAWTPWLQTTAAFVPIGDSATETDLAPSLGLLGTDPASLTHEVAPSTGISLALDSAAESTGNILVGVSSLHYATAVGADSPLAIALGITADAGAGTGSALPIGLRSTDRGTEQAAALALAAAVWSTGAAALGTASPRVGLRGTDAAAGASLGLTATRLFAAAAGTQTPTLLTVATTLRLYADAATLTTPRRGILTHTVAGYLADHASATLFDALRARAVATDGATSTVTRISLAAHVVVASAGTVRSVPLSLAAALGLASTDHATAAGSVPRLHWYSTGSDSGTENASVLGTRAKLYGGAGTAGASAALLTHAVTVVSIDARTAAEWHQVKAALVAHEAAAAAGSVPALAAHVVVASAGNASADAVRVGITAKDGARAAGSVPRLGAGVFVVDAAAGRTPGRPAIGTSYGASALAGYFAPSYFAPGYFSPRYFPDLTGTTGGASAPVFRRVPGIRRAGSRPGLA